MFVWLSLLHVCGIFIILIDTCAKKEYSYFYLNVWRPSFFLCWWIWDIYSIFIIRKQNIDFIFWDFLETTVGSVRVKTGTGSGDRLPLLVLNIQTPKETNYSPSRAAVCLQTVKQGNIWNDSSGQVCIGYILVYTGNGNMVLWRFCATWSKAPNIYATLSMLTQQEVTAPQRRRVCDLWNTPSQVSSFYRRGTDSVTCILH